MHNLCILGLGALHAGSSQSQRSSPRQHTDQSTAPAGRAALALLPGTVLVQLSRRSGAPATHSEIAEALWCNSRALPADHSSATESTRCPRGRRVQQSCPVDARPVFRHSLVRQRRPAMQTWRVTFFEDKKRCRGGGRLYSERVEGTRGVAQRLPSTCHMQARNQRPSSRSREAMMRAPRQRARRAISALRHAMSPGATRTSVAKGIPTPEPMGSTARAALGSIFQRHDICLQASGHHIVVRKLLVFCSTRAFI